MLSENVGYVTFLLKSHLQQIFLGYADVKGSKTDTKS